MELICLFCPEIIGLCIFLKLYPKFEKKNLYLILYYFANVLLINFIILIISKVIFNIYSYVFTVNFSLKYIILSVFLSSILPICVYYLPNKFKKTSYYCELYKRLKIMIKKHKNILINIAFVTTLILSYFALDIYIKYIAYKVANFYQIISIANVLFTIGYCLIILLIAIILPKILAKVFLIVTYIFNILIFIVNFMLIQIKGVAFSFNELANANEGVAYINFIFKEINWELLIIIAISIILFIFSFKFFKKLNFKKQIRKKIIITICLIILFSLTRVIALKMLGSNEEDTWQEIKNPRYHYNYYINANNSLLVSGLYEYTFRDFYLYLKNNYTTYGSIKEIEEYINNSTYENNENDMTGYFENKNLIMIMLESIDNLVINDEVMPTLNYMRENGWDFTGRYTSNCSTIATEYASMTGLYHLGSSFNISNNQYSNSLLNMFNNNGYITNSIHENRGLYYNRSVLHKSLGFNNSYFLYDILDTPLYYEDRQIIENDDLYNAIISKEEKFMTFIITLSAHGPYENKSYCLANNPPYTDEFDCLKFMSNKTDIMLEKLLERLKEDNLLDDTVIVLYSDHYPYAYSFTEEQLNSLKAIDENKSIRNLPFIIYSNDLQHKEYTDFINDVDILPTILNLFNIEYNAKEYIGSDYFSDSHENIMFLSNGTWYDGNIFSYDEIISEEDKEYFNFTTQFVNEKLDLNKMIISNNYYAK